MSLTTLFKLVPDAGNVRSVNFFNGRLLSAEDLTREQAAGAELRRRIGRAMGDGVAYGLEVSRAPAARLVGNGPLVHAVLMVEPGLAVAPDGRTLLLPSRIGVSLVEGIAEAAPSVVPAAGGCGVAGAFAPCSLAPTGDFATGEGYYVLTLAAALGAEGRAPTSGLQNGLAPCNTKYVVDAVQFRLIRYPFDSADPLQSIGAALRRGLLAAFCFGLDAGADPIAAPDDPLPGSLLRLGMEEKLRTAGHLADCEVPLAVLFWATPLAGTQGAEFVDTWAVRRRVTLPYPQGPFDPLLAARRSAESEAHFFQFQDHLDALAQVPGANLSATRAAEHFTFLPPAGFLPVGTGRFVPDTFFDGFDFEKAAGDPAFVRLFLHDALFAEPIGVVAPDVPLVVLNFDAAPDYVMFLRRQRSFAPPVVVTPPTSPTTPEPETPPVTTPPSQPKTGAFVVKVLRLGKARSTIRVTAQGEDGSTHTGVATGGASYAAQVYEAAVLQDELLLYKQGAEMAIDAGGPLEFNDPYRAYSYGGSSGHGATQSTGGPSQSNKSAQPKSGHYEAERAKDAFELVDKWAARRGTDISSDRIWNTFHITAVPRGTYVISAFAAGYSTASVQHTLGEGQTAHISLTLVERQIKEIDPKREFNPDDLRDKYGRQLKRVVIPGNPRDLIGPRPPFPDPVYIIPKSDDAAKLKGLLQGLIDKDPSLRLPVTGQDPQIMVRGDYKPGTISDDPYAVIVSGNVAIPVVLVPGEQALPKSVPASRSGVPEITTEAFADRLASAGAGDMDVAANLWSKALGEALDIPTSAARGVLTDLRGAVAEVRQSRGYYAGMPGDLSAALKKNKVTDAELANAGDAAAFLDTLDLTGDQKAGLAGYTSRLIEQARGIVSESGWSLSAPALGLKSGQLAALNAQGIRTQGDLHRVTGDDAGVNAIAGVLNVNADAVRGINENLTTNLGVAGVAAVEESGVLSLPRVSEARAEAMVAAGYDTITKVADAPPEALATAIGSSVDEATAITRDAAGRVLVSTGVATAAEVTLVMGSNEIRNLSDVATKTDVVKDLAGAAGVRLGSVAGAVRTEFGGGGFRAGIGGGFG